METKITKSSDRVRLHRAEVGCMMTTTKAKEAPPSI